MYSIQPLFDDPATLQVTIDGLFRVELIRRAEGLSINVYAAKTDAPITETWATNGEALDDDDDDAGHLPADNPRQLS